MQILNKSNSRKVINFMRRLVINFLAVFIFTPSIFAKPGAAFKEIDGLSKNAQGLLAFLSSVEVADTMLFEVFNDLPHEAIYKLMLVTSAANECIGCVCTAVQKLKKLKVSEKDIVALQTTEFSSQSKKDKSLFTLARELTLRPGTAPKFVELASKDGWTDDQLTHAILIVSQFNLKNRIRNGFDLGPDKSHPYKIGQKLPMASCEEHCTTGCQ